MHGELGWVGGWVGGGVVRGGGGGRALNLRYGTDVRLEFHDPIYSYILKI